jgi:predicted nucleotidyltransferase
MNKDKLDKIKNILEDLSIVEFAYLFGSYAKGEENNWSDIDIAVFTNSTLNTLDTYLEIHHKLAVAFHEEIDLVILNNAKNFYLLKDIFNEGIILKDTVDSKRKLYEVDKMHEIIDYFELKRILDVA